MLLIMSPVPSVPRGRASLRSGTHSTRLTVDDPEGPCRASRGPRGIQIRDLFIIFIYYLSTSTGTAPLVIIHNHLSFFFIWSKGKRPERFAKVLVHR